MLITERQPFIPHAHGIRVLLCPERYFNPVGKGMPIKNATGAIRMIENSILRKNGRLMEVLKMGVRINAYNIIKNITKERIIKIFL